MPKFRTIVEEIIKSYKESSEQDQHDYDLAGKAYKELLKELSPDEQFPYVVLEDHDDSDENSFVYRYAILNDISNELGLKSALQVLNKNLKFIDFYTIL